MPQILFETGRGTQVTKSSDFVNHGGLSVFETAGEGWQQLPCAGGGASRLLNRLQFDPVFGHQPFRVLAAPRGLTIPDMRRRMGRAGPCRLRNRGPKRGWSD